MKRTILQLLTLVLTTVVTAQNTAELSPTGKAIEWPLYDTHRRGYRRTARRGGYHSPNTVEPSKADVHNRELGVFLSNAFSRAFRISINDDPAMTLRDLFYNLARTTTGSHVTLYNDVNYGSVYSLNAGDYFPE